MHKIKIENSIITAKNGELLSTVFEREGIIHAHPCGCKGICQKCTVLVNGKKELSCKYRVESDITVEQLKNGNILSESGARFTNRFTDNLCFALDIGSTTLTLALVSLDENEIISEITRTNPQVTFGADVISRIDYCSKNSAEPLKSVLINQLNSMVCEFNIGQNLKLFVAGNTVMLHLFFGEDCSAMGVAPYTPIFLESKEVSGERLGLKGITTVISVPCISAFVGADIVAGLNFIPKPQKDKCNLLVDLGTNAEIVLYSEDFALCTAAAAGPCFEGANISCGMSAQSGAVYSFKIDQNGTKHYKTIGDVKPVGICGTGLIDIITELVKNRIIDESGYMEYEKYYISHDVYLSKSDIRQFQLAKSAVYSAILSLMKIKDIDFCNIDKMYISGGFSAKINVENAVSVGLLPKELKEKCVAANNTSLLGTVKIACGTDDTADFVSEAKYVDLSSDSHFSNLFIENMEF